MTEQWFVPPGRGSLSFGQIIPPNDYLLSPLTAAGKAGGPNRVASSRPRGLADTLGINSLVKGKFDLHRHFNFFRNPPTIPRQAATGPQDMAKHCGHAAGCRVGRAERAMAPA